MKEVFSTTVTIPDHLSGQRLDQALASLLADYSRGAIQKWIAQGEVLLDGQVANKKQPVHGGEQVTINASLPQADHWQAQDLPLTVVAESADYIVINKPVGLVVHPAAGNPDHTLVNALLHHYPELSALPRAGVVHRLDKDTSGLMVVARSLIGHTSLVRQIQAKTVNRTYQAIVNGVLTGGGTVDQSIGRHPVARKKMAVVANGKPAVSHYSVLARFSKHTHVEVRLETGRTHQIRVHMAYLGHPLVGDKIYGARLVLPNKAGSALKTAMQSFSRQALHAVKLEFACPSNGEILRFAAPLPDDMVQLLDLLTAHEGANRDASH